MIAWLALKTGLSVLVVKLIMLAAALAAILLCLRWYGNRQYYEGETAGRLYEAKAIEKAKQAEWDAKNATIAQAAAKVALEKSSVMAATEQLARDRANLSRTLSDNLAAIQRERIRQYANAASVPDNRIWDDIRAVSSQLAAHP